MKINVVCENNSDTNSFIETNELEKISSDLLVYLLGNNLVQSFSESNDYEFDILLTNNKFIHQINKEYRGKDSPTDVITFALYADSENKLVLDNKISLGQIIISLDKVEEQAKDNNISTKQELLNLLCHGILHLLGIDHPDEQSLEYMLELQNKMIESINNVKI